MRISKEPGSQNRSCGQAGPSASMARKAPTTWVFTSLARLWAANAASLSGPAEKSKRKWSTICSLPYVSVCVLNLLSDCPILLVPCILKPWTKLDSTLIASIIGIPLHTPVCGVPICTMCNVHMLYDINAINTPHDRSGHMQKTTQVRFRVFCAFYKLGRYHLDLLGILGVCHSRSAKWLTSNGTWQG